MARQSPSQKDTVERVMHEFKHGELQSGSGRKVTNPRQAIAIGLSEAGASDQQSPEENRTRERQTKSRERQSDTGKDRAEGPAVGGGAAEGDGGRGGKRAGGKSGPERTRADLYEEAKRRRIPGRSRMGKAELAQALAG